MFFNKENKFQELYDQDEDEQPMTKRLKKIYIKLTDYSISRNKVTQNQEENHEEMSLFSALGDMKDG